MPVLSITPDPACPDSALFAYRTAWNAQGQFGDWAKSAGALDASHPLETEVICCLFTDRACPPDHPLAHLADGDFRGYWGDSLAKLYGEPPRGSLLWLLERATCSEANRRWAEIFALDGLAPLVSAGVAANATAAAAILPQRNGIALDVALIGSDGRKAFATQYEILWNAR